MYYSKIQCQDILSKMDIYMSLPTLNKYMKRDFIALKFPLKKEFIKQEKFHEYMLFFKRYDYRLYYLLNYMSLYETIDFLDKHFCLSFINDNKKRNIIAKYKKYYKEDIILIGQRYFLSNKYLNILKKDLIS